MRLHCALAAALLVPLLAAASRGATKEQLRLDDEAADLFKKNLCTAADKAFVRAAAHAEKEGSLSLAVWAYSNLAQVRSMNGRPKEAAAAMDRAAPLADKAGLDAGESGHFHYSRGMAHRGLKTPQDLSLAEREYRRAVSDFERAGDTRRLANSLVELGLTLNDEGRKRDGIVEVSSAAALLQGTTYYKDLAAKCENLAYLYSEVPFWPQAFASYECAVSNAEKAGTLISREWRALLQYYSGDLKANGMSEKARPIDAMVARIDALPKPDKGGGCLDADAGAYHLYR